MTTEIRGQRVLITGASSGIGAETARQFARAGARLSLVAWDSAGLEQVAAQCRELGAEVLAIACDVSQRGAARDAVEQSVATLGGLDVLFANAGIFQPTPAAGNEPEAALDLFEKIVDINLKGAAYFAYYCAPHILANADGPLGRGSIIFLASIAGKRGYSPYGGYCASKHGMVGLAGSIFEELREQRVKVCVICPGLVNTQMVEHFGFEGKQMIQAADLAEVVLQVAAWPGSSCPLELLIDSTHRFL